MTNNNTYPHGATAELYLIRIPICANQNQINMIFQILNEIFF